MQIASLHGGIGSLNGMSVTTALVLNTANNYLSSRQQGLPNPIHTSKSACMYVRKLLAPRAMHIRSRFRRRLDYPSVSLALTTQHVLKYHGMSRAAVAAALSAISSAYKLLVYRTLYLE